MATEYEQRLRSRILHMIAFQGPEWPQHGEWVDNPEDPEGAQFIAEELDRLSAGEFTITEEQGDERMYILDTYADGLSSRTYTIVDSVRVGEEYVRRIRTVILYVEGASAILYNAEYGEPGLEF